MKDLMITAYSGFSTVSGETNLTTVITNIRNGAYFHTVRKVEQQLRLGDLSKANAIKKQLPFFYTHGKLLRLAAALQPASLQPRHHRGRGRAGGRPCGCRPPFA